MKVRQQNTSNKSIRDTFQLTDEIYILGSLETGVTVYRQQIRALNLMWSLRQQMTSRKGALHPKNIAVVGGGIAGLTAASATLMLDATVKVKIFERQTDICPLQQGCDTRWIHPHIYDWPREGSRAPSASIPILNWREGRASDVSHQVLREFKKVCETADNNASRLEVILDTRHLLIDAASMAIEWSGRPTTRRSGFFFAQESVGKTETFDVIVLAIGFGRENFLEPYKTVLYWQNDVLAQPNLDDSKKTLIVSGAGDGAIVDLCRLTIERFRQDRIVYELFQTNLSTLESRLRLELNRRKRNENWFDFFQRMEKTLLAPALAEVAKRLRKDTRTIACLGGKEGKASSIRDAFRAKTSFLNKLLLYLLYRSGGFIPSFASVEEVAKRYDVNINSIVCRHGPNTKAAIDSIFSKNGSMARRLSAIKRAQKQLSVPLWPAGHFPSP